MRPPITPDAPLPGQESVWDYPRPPRLEPSRRRVRITVGDAVLADVGPGEGLAWRVLETSHPPTYYVARSAVEESLLRPAAGGSWCEFKGKAGYVDVLGPDGVLAAEAAGWYYRTPSLGYEAIAGALAFYPGRVHCELDGEVVRAQAGGFYGGWITDDVAGPFKGEPGTLGW